ncbi:MULTISPECIES: HlyD family secretion protein [unclassified Aliivibrio]|uniref:HlyD family secretion protein n=1 Tax=unclassified Aliivibrio TaxID=2645654 RepID=UPI00080E621E|nr:MULTISPECIES: HlyD family efflux transporter periplasmic adaptor subunit [unclassified Aliivibrio]OCH14822.1 permease [Aliivibrio sp. 1S165]OCH25852.1 permease [Aliivibrio sp. 1S128]OCH34778.1 permease [Aliivibrio sp. 1S175]
MDVKFHLDKKKNPTSEKGMKVMYGSEKRGGYRIRWYLILAIIFSPIIFMIYTFAKLHLFTTALGIITTGPVVITATQSGIVDVIDVKDSEFVLEEQLLITLETPVLEEEIAFIENELEMLAYEKKEKITEDFSPYISAISAAKLNLAKIRTIKGNYDKYANEGKVSQVDYASIIGLYNTAQNNLTNAYIALNQAKIAQKQRLVAGGIAQVTRQLNQSLTTKKNQINELLITAPYMGVVIDINTLLGQQVNVGDPLVTISPDVAPYVISYLEPKHIEKATLGTLVTVTLPNGKKVDARVSSSIGLTSKLPAQLAKPFEGTKALLKVKITFVGGLLEHEWVEGMPVEVSFDHWHLPKN